MNKWFVGLAACGLLAWAGEGRLNAGIVVFSGYDAGAGSTDPRPLSNAAAASFDAAVGSKSILDFESAPLGQFNTLAVNADVTLTGGSNTSIRNTPFGTPDRLFGYNTTAGGSQFLSVVGGTVTFHFNTAIDSFGGYVSGLQLVGETLTFSDGQQETVTLPAGNIALGGIAFVGFTDAGASVVAITLNTNVGNAGDIVGVDDVRYGHAGGASAVPEPASMTLLMLGGLGLAGYGWRRRRTGAPA